MYDIIAKSIACTSVLYHLLFPLGANTHSFDDISLNGLVRWSIHRFKHGMTGIKGSPTKMLLLAKELVAKTFYDSKQNRYCEILKNKA